MSVSDGVCRARFDAVAAENTSRIIDVVSLCEPFACGDALSGGILGCLNVDAICRACRSAEKTGYALFQTLFIAMKNMNPAIARLKMHGLFRIIFSYSFSK
jgi:hypothetical protein